MKVHELIELLKDCNEDAYAMVDLGVKSGRSWMWTAIPMDVVGVWGWPGDLGCAHEIYLALEPCRTREDKGATS